MKRLLLGLWLFSSSAHAVPKAQTWNFEPKAHALLRKTFDHYRALKSYTGTIRWHRDGSALKGLDAKITDGDVEVRCEQPKLFLSSGSSDTTWKSRLINNGKFVYMDVFPNGALQFTRKALSQDVMWDMSFVNPFGIRALLQNKNPLQPYGSHVRSIVPGKSQSKGVTRIIVRIEKPNTKIEIDYFVGEADLSLRGVRVHQVVQGKTLDASEDHSNIKFNPTISVEELEPDAEMKRRAEQSGQP